MATARFDVFISHASEDKDDFVRPLAAALASLGLKVWFDEWTLSIGDSLRQKIEEGLAASDYGVVILSRSFFQKNWPNAELDGLVAREMEGRKVILPVWHNVTKKEVLEYSPILAGKLAAPTDEGVAAVAEKLYLVIRPQQANTTRKTLNPNSPRKPLFPASEPITELLRCLHEAAPLLHKLDETMTGLEAQKFFAAMQVFFHGRNLLTDEVDEQLCFGTDNLLRVLSSAGEHPDYMFGKLACARMCFEDFRKRSHIGHELPEIKGGSHPCVDIQYLHASFFGIIENLASIKAVDQLVLRLISALLDYGRHQHVPKHRYPPIPPSLHRALREFLTHAFAKKLNLGIPDPLDNILTGDMKAYCGFAWDQFSQERRGEISEIMGLIWQSVVGRWRRARVKTVRAEDVIRF